MANPNGTFLNFPTFSLKVEDRHECTMPMTFFGPLLPVPLEPDYNAPRYTATASPAITRSMASTLPQPLLSEISNAFLQAPLTNDAPNSQSNNGDDNYDSENDNTHLDDNPDSPANVIIKPTTTTPNDRPSLPVHYKQFSSAPKIIRFTTHEPHTMLGSRSLRNWHDIGDIALPTVQVSETGDIPLELGDVTNLRSARKNKTPVPRPENFLDIVHCDLRYGDCASVGGVRYVLMLVDRATWYTWTHGLKSLTQEEIVKGFVKFKLAMGKLPKRIYTDFDHRLLSGITEKYLNKFDCDILGAPASRQHQNGLVERQWQTLMNMSRSYLSNKLIPRTYWWWAMRHASQVINMFPCTVNNLKTPPLELVYGVKPDYSVLLPLFSTAYFKHDRDSDRARDGSESKVLQAILLGRAFQSDGYLLYSPYTKEFYLTGDCKIDKGNSTATAFNLKYDGGMFFGLYDSSHISNGTEPYPPGTTVTFTDIDNKKMTGTVVTCPLPDHDKGFPSSSSTCANYSIKMTSGKTITLSAEALDLIMDSRHDESKTSMPKWIHTDAKVMFFHKNNYHKGWLSYNEDDGWEFQVRRRNGDVRWFLKLPNLLSHHSDMIDTKIMLPGWSNSVR